MLIVDNSTDITGAFNSILYLTNELSANFEFTFLIQKDSSTKNRLKMLGYTFFEMRFIELSKSLNLILYLPQLIINTINLKSIVKKNEIAILHINDLYNMLGVTIKIFYPRIKVVYHVRLLPSSYVKNLYFIWKWLIERFGDDIICVSETVSSNFNNEKTSVIFDSIPISKLKIDANHSQDKECFTILYLANYIQGKGHKQALKAYQLALPNINNTRLVFYGGLLGRAKNKDFKENLIEFAKNLGIEKNISFNGFTDHPEREIINADLMLNFSESESFSMTTLEALVYGTPIIATDCGGPSEIIENWKSGILVPINNTVEMATSIIKLVNDKELRESISLNGKKRAEMKFNFYDQIKLLSSIYNRLLF